MNIDEQPMPKEYILENMRSWLGSWQPSLQEKFTSTANHPFEGTREILNRSTARA
jgi:hypothetical protein